MIINFNFANSATLKNYNNLAIFWGENQIDKNFNYNEIGIKKDQVTKLFKGNKKKFETINLPSNKKILFIKLNNDKKNNRLDLQGAEFFNFLKENQIYDLYFGEKNIREIIKIN